jgi:hypothetical protein
MTIFGDRVGENVEGARMGLAEGDFVQPERIEGSTTVFRSSAERLNWHILLI